MKFECENCAKREYGTEESIKKKGWHEIKDSWYCKSCFDDLIPGEDEESSESSEEESSDDEDDDDERSGFGLGGFGKIGGGGGFGGGSFGGGGGKW